MNIPFLNNAKVFVTTNVDIDGNVISTGFTTSNTWQIPVIKDTLSITQEKSYAYINKSTLLENTSYASFVSDSELAPGSFAFSTYLCKITQDTADSVLISSMSSELDSAWELGSGYMQLGLTRTTNLCKVLGILVIVDNVLFVVNKVRVASMSLDLSIDSMIRFNWVLNFSNYSTNTDSTLQLTESGTTYTFTGDLTGTAERYVPENTIYALSKMVKTQVLKQDEILGYLVTASLSLDINNNLQYMKNNGIDRSNNDHLFLTAGDSTITGSLAFYMRGGATTSLYSTLLKDLDLNNSDPYYYSKYCFLLNIMTSNNQPLCDIYIDNCAVSSNLDTSGALITSLSYSVTDDIINNSFIKFYT